MQAGGTLLLSVILKKKKKKRKAVNTHKAKSVNEAICHWQGMDGDALLKTRRPLVFAHSTVCLLNWVCTWKLQDMCVWTVGILMRAWKQKQKGNWFTVCSSSVSSETRNRLQRSSVHGRFYRLLLPLYPHRREACWKGFFRGFRRTSCSGFYRAFCFIFLRSPPLIYDALHGTFKWRVVF